MSEVTLTISSHCKAFKTLEVGKIYIDGLCSHFEIYEFFEKDGCFLGKMVDRPLKEFYETLERYNADGSIFDTLPCPPEHHLKYVVTA